LRHFKANDFKEDLKNLLTNLDDDMNKPSLLHLILIALLSLAMASCENNQGNNADQESEATGPAMQPESTAGMDMTGMGGMQQGSEVAMDEIGEPRMSDQGLFRVTVTPQQEPVPLNTMHNWVIHVETASGQSVDNAVISVAGGMPAHMHGMPTAPQVTQSLGNGDHLVEGMQFQMPGHWEVELNINAASQQDNVSFNFNLQP
jgi:hypothetical protein